MAFLGLMIVGGLLMVRRPKLKIAMSVLLPWWRCSAWRFCPAAADRVAARASNPARSASAERGLEIQLILPKRLASPK